MLFATEGFESFNAVIRSYSIHSNRHAPSRDIARAMGQSNRLRHLLSGGYFPLPTDLDDEVNSDAARASSTSHVRSEWLQTHSSRTHIMQWKTPAPEVHALMQDGGFAAQVFGLEDDEREGGNVQGAV